jgi:rubrerythrin
MLDANIQGETISIENYLKAIEIVKNESLKQLFYRIIEDEKRHIEIFKTIKNNVKFLSL